MIIGYRYARKDNLEDVFLCCDCNDGYRGDYGNIALYSDLLSIDQWAQRQLCKHCGLKLIDAMKRSESVQKYESIQIANRKLSIPGVLLSDVAKALEEKQIPLTKENIEAAATHVESIASAYAKATLQDTNREEWLEWIETFKK